MISRVAFRDNSSKYYINDRPSNFTEVTKKLKGKGVDLDNNRFLILQVQEIVSNDCCSSKMFICTCSKICFGIARVKLSRFH